MAEQIFGQDTNTGTDDHNYMVVEDDGSTNSNIVKPIDAVSGGLTTISAEHHEMHEGDHYFFKSFIVDSGGSGSTTVFSFTTPNTATRIHAKASLTPDVDYTISIYEGADITGGAPLNGVNNDRDSLNVAELVAVSAPTVNVIGDRIWAARNGGGKDPIGVSPGFNYEIIAKTDTTYIFEIVKNIANTGVVDIDFWWYEHAPSNP